MNDTYAPHAQPINSTREEPRAARRDEYVLRFDRSTPLVAAAAFAVGVLVGFVLD
ncbi:hypothetical protein [Hyphomicrobium sp. CS1GBMeth3]|uniref:hypothetical protein n=1 Tax=Hyphomicrobium sp. CS1GBMeth3 TaxID=1892845 RepID=UPI000AB17B17|nr:hypothetical protein [Hyphomicrobium sp. CS1GBMeth3]